MERARLEFINNNIHKLFNSEISSTSILTFMPNTKLDFESTCILNEITSLIGVWNLRLVVQRDPDEYCSLFIEYMELETLKHIINTKCLEYYKSKLVSTFYIIDGNFDVFKESFYNYLNNYVEFNLNAFKLA
jgi:hypothetical protein